MKIKENISTEDLKKLTESLKREKVVFVEKK